LDRQRGQRELRTVFTDGCRYEYPHYRNRYVDGQDGIALVSVINADTSASFAYPVPWKSNAGVPVCFTDMGTGVDVNIRIYTTSGREVFHTTVTNTPDPASQKCQFSWDTKNSSGEKVASGVYLYIIESPTNTKHGKLIIIQ